MGEEILTLRYTEIEKKKTNFTVMRLLFLKKM